MKKRLLGILMLGIISIGSLAQDTTKMADESIQLLTRLEKETKPVKTYTSATFKTTRIINGHTVENTGKNVLDVRISHRFGQLNDGGYNLFGLDEATMRLGFDYGITSRFTIGIGRSTFQKTYDGFLKIKLLRQSSGKNSVPVTVSYVPAIALRTLKFDNPKIKNSVSNQLVYTHQLLIARKFSEGTSLQLMPTFVHQNLAIQANDPNNMFALGVGGRQKISKRVSINVEYYPVIGERIQGTTDALSIGFDIETGGHVFQLHFTNSRGMTEHNIITQTQGKWGKGDILFGFNISRVFNIGKRSK